MSYAARFGRLACRFVLILCSACLACDQSRPRNIILMISDGAGFNAWKAADMYQGRAGRQVYDQPGWVRLACSTYPLTRSSTPTGKGVQNEDLVYDPTKVWGAGWASTADQAGGKPDYSFIKSTCTDSAATATAIACGVKTYNSAINWSDSDSPLAPRTIAHLAKSVGKAVGVVTSVQISHATPAALAGAAVNDRNDYEQIANQMLSSDHLDLIMGAGHPEFNNAGKAANKTTQFVGGDETWRQLRDGEHPGGWRLVQSRQEFESLASALPANGRILGIAQAASTLRQRRPSRDWDANGSIDAADIRLAPVNPGDDSTGDPFNSNVPTLATMTRAALNILCKKSPGGLFLVVEGGAVDWACHDNQPARMIEEQLDFIHAVEAAVEWIGANGGWGQTLLILTADHECGLVLGPAGDNVTYDAIVDKRPGEIPAMSFQSASHTNQLVPLYARGPSADLFETHAEKTDPVFGPYVDNTDIFNVMVTALGLEDFYSPADKSATVKDQADAVCNE